MEMLQQVFRGQAIRAGERDGKSWIVAKDVAEALGISWTSRTLDAIKPEWKGVMEFITPGGAQELTVISEPAVYKLAFRSRKVEAEAFTDWVAGGLLPTLRRTGFYSLREAVVTPHAIARAYGVATKNVPYYMEHHQIHPVGHAENPDTGKLVAVYPRQPVLEQFMLGGGMRQGFELRAYSGAWEKVRPALAG
jgi:prophage antirepressor-like protein